MPTKNIECQLAQGQIGRYLNGERFSPQAIRQLEAHVADCDECSELVTRRRQALLTMLGERNSNLAVVSPKNENPAPTNSAVEKEVDVNHRLMEAISKVTTASTSTPSPHTTPTPVQENQHPAQNSAPPAEVNKIRMFAHAMNSKPLIYCTGLAIVLLGMSYLSRGALKAFGPTADQASPAVSNDSNVTVAKVETTKTASPTNRSAEKPKEPVKKSAALPAPAIKTGSEQEPMSVPPKKESAPKAKIIPIAVPPPVAERPTLKPVASRLRRPATSRRVSIRARHMRPVSRIVRTRAPRRFNHVRQSPAAPAPSGIRIYDPQGRPIQ